MLKVNVEKLNALIKAWDNREPEARNLLINEIAPLLKDFSQIELGNGQVINTPLKMFSAKDIAQTVALKLTEKYPSKENNYIDGVPTFETIENLLISLRQMLFHAMVDEARSLTNSKNSASKRVKLFDCTDDDMPADDGSIEHDSLFARLADIFDVLAITYPKKLLAFELNVFRNASIDEVAEFMNISIPTSRKYIKHIRLAVISALRERVV